MSAPVRIIGATPLEIGARRAQCTCYDPTSGRQCVFVAEYRLALYTSTGSRLLAPELYACHACYVDLRDDGTLDCVYSEVQR